jgi:hypothetical protein
VLIGNATRYPEDLRISRSFILGGFIMKKSAFWIVYKASSKKERKELLRWNFWAWMMNHFPRIYDWCEKHLPFDTLPF